MDDKFSWVDEQEKSREDDYFTVKEGKQQFMLLSHAAPLAQVWDNASQTYRLADEGDKNPSIKGICWVLQDGKIKQARLPYTVIKSIRAIQQDPEWEFELPFNHVLTLEAIGAGTKEVKYSLTPSPKTQEIPKEILELLKEKPSPEDLVERFKTFKKPEPVTSEDVPF